MLEPRTRTMAGAVLLLAILSSCNGSTGSGDAAVEAPARGAAAELWPQPATPEIAAETDAFVDGLMSKMTVEEKVGQVIQAELRSVTAEDIRRYHLGSVLNGGGATPNNDKHASAADWVAVADEFYAASMDTADGNQAIPVLWGSDAVHGHSNVYGATIFPHNIGLGAANDPALIRDIGAVTAIEMRVTGLDWTFAPTLAVVRDDRWGRTYEGYSEDPRIVAAYAGAIVEGLQGVAGTDSYLGTQKILATAKHYLGDGGTVGGRDQGDNIASEAELVRLHAAGYPPAIEAGVRTIMASFNSWQGEKLHGHRYLLTTALKDRMGFDGFVVGDWNGHGQVEGCSNTSCAEAFNAGLDMFMVPEDFGGLYENTLAQVRSGEIAEQRLDDAVRRILRVKKQAGLFESRRPSARPYAGRQELLGAPEHRAVARRAVRQSLVLLKNNDATLPLSPGLSVLVAGDGADDIGKQTGGWTLSWQGTGNTNADFPNATSIFGGIREAVEAAGGSAELAVDGEWQSKPDVAIVVYGEDPYAEFQGDRANLLYEDQDGPDLALLGKLAADDIPVVSVFLSGRPMWVNPHINASDAFVAAWLPGSEGAGIADLLFLAADGKRRFDFTGRLSFSWPKSAGQTAVNVGDENYDPLFAYGYGLSLDDEVAVAELPEDPGLDASDAAQAGVYYSNGRAFAGFSARVGSAREALVTVQGLELTGVVPEVLMADREVQGDASRLEWPDDEAGWFVIAAQDDPIDLEREANDQLSLSLWMQVETAPDVPLLLGMRDAGGTASSIDLGPLLAGPGEWRRYRISLRCFGDRGVDMSRIAAPLELYTSDDASLVIAEVRLASAAEGAGQCPGGE